MENGGDDAPLAPVLAGDGVADVGFATKVFVGLGGFSEGGEVGGGEVAVDDASPACAFETVFPVDSN